MAGLTMRTGQLVDAIFTDTSNNVGIGIAPSAWSGFTAFQVGNAANWSTGTNNSHWSSNTYYDGTNRIYIGSDYATEYAQQSGAHKWFIATSGTAGGTISTTQAMTLDASGNLGVGDTSPTLGGNYRSVVINGVSGSIYRTKVNGTTAFDIQADPSITYLFDYRSVPIVIGTGGVERLRIASTGAATFSSSVTAGGTITLNAPSANYATLNLNGAGGYGAELKFGEATGGYLAAIRHNYNVGTGLEFYTGGVSGANLRMYIAPSGNVGIGTTNPLAPFVVSNSGGIGMETLVTVLPDASAGSYIQTYNRATSSFVTMGFNASEYRWYFTNTERMRITSGGNVGIGTSSPANKLDVNGTVRAMGYDGGGTGAGLELFYLSGVSYVSSQDRSVSGYVPLYIRSSATSFTNGNVLIGTTTDAGNLVQLKNASAIGWANSNSWTWGLYKATNDFYIKYTSGGDISAGTTALQFTGGTGAATFSSSVKVPSGASGGLFKMDYAANTASRSWQIAGDGYNYGDFVIQQSTTQTGSTYDTKFILFASGNAGLGTTTDDGGNKLQVNGSITSVIGYYNSSALTTITALNTSFLLTAGAFAGIITARDNTHGGSGVWLQDPNGGAVLISSNWVNGTYTIIYSGGSTYIQKTSGTVPSVVAFNMFSV